MRPRQAGHVAAGFEGVAEQFELNFTERGDLGAAFAAVLDGEPVVDLWGGFADPAQPVRVWSEDTLQLIFSGTKALVATCMLMLIERGRLALDDEVCRHWPEFAANGKRAITVADLMSHRARLPGVRTPLRDSDLTDARALAELLAEQAPETDPRAVAVYHPLTFGWLCGELVRRVDGRTVGHFFAEEVAGPLDLELWIGLPEENEARVSTLVRGPGMDGGRVSDEAVLAADELLARVWANPPDPPDGSMPWNGRPYHAAEIPGANAIGTARSVARLFGCLARGGELDGVQLLRPETLELARCPLSRFRDPLLDEPMAYGAGFQLQTPLRSFGPPANAFGHAGAGGSIHAAWPDQRVGVSYAMNEMRNEPAGDPRSQSLLQVLFEAVGRRGHEGSRPESTSVAQ
jgi:CubicO group peptidase (beta-lactamase class C family)